MLNKQAPFQKCLSIDKHFNMSACIYTCIDTIIRDALLVKANRACGVQDYVFFTRLRLLTRTPFVDFRRFSINRKPALNAFWVRVHKTRAP